MRKTLGIGNCLNCGKEFAITHDRKMFCELACYLGSKHHREIAVQSCILGQKARTEKSIETNGHSGVKFTREEAQAALNTHSTVKEAAAALGYHKAKMWVLIKDWELTVPPRLIVPTSRGYYSVNSPLHHRKVVEAATGRTLAPSEFVHHKDGNRANNALSNLSVMSHIKHNKAHKTLLQCAYELYKQGVIKFNEETQEYEI